MRSTRGSVAHAHAQQQEQVPSGAGSSDPPRDYDDSAQDYDHHQLHHQHHHSHHPQAHHQLPPQHSGMQSQQQQQHQRMSSAPHYGYNQSSQQPMGFDSHYGPNDMPAHLGQHHHQDVGPSTGGGGGAASRKRKAPASANVDGDEDDDEKPLGKEGKTAGGASDFVKKLYKMLEDGEYNDIVSWGYTGDSFVVKDMNAFTRTILPLHFKHSNFASFVRQLNKYDFHKVKNPDENNQPYGEHAWEFRHPNFRSDMKEALEHIKRKGPAPRKGTPQPGGARRGNAAAAPEAYGGPPNGFTAADLAALQSQIDGLQRAHHQMSQHVKSMSQDYQAVMGEMMNFQRNMVAQDQLTQNLIQYLINLEADHNAAIDSNADINAYQPSSEAQKLISSYNEAARGTYDQMTDLSRRASLSNGALPPIPPPPPGFGHFDVSRIQPGRRESHQRQDKAPGQQQQSREQQQQQSIDPEQASSSNDNSGGSGSNAGNATGPGPNNSSGGGGMQNFSQQHFQHPNAPALGRDGSSNGAGSAPATRTTPTMASAPRNTYVPGWAVPPRVLLVEDDAVCRKLSSKFLELFGCAIDVAVDGVSAVNKMNMQKYDLVLMDIVMPNLDGVSATSLIRQFDPMTPIISMTSNSGPNEIMTYFSHGMNDILPKPFTKEGLLGMLEKHLIHLKVMQQMAEIPRALGFTDDQIQDALAVSTVGEEGQVMNPFSAMGISDNDYVEMLQGIALKEEGKRGLEVVLGDERAGKRARFQPVGE